MIDYITKNPGCNKKAAVKHCEDKGVGSYTVLFDRLNELQIEGIVKRTERGRLHLMTVVADNLLVSIPDDLETIFVRFLEFLELVKEAKSGKKQYSKSGYVYNGKKAMQDIKLENRIFLLPYEVLEIIRKIYVKFFESVIKYKLDKQKDISTLYGVYCEKNKQMESFLYKNFPLKKELISLLEIRKHESPLGKACNVVDICRYLKIKDQLYNFLNVLWERNIETCVLLYGLEAANIKTKNFEEQDEEIKRRADSIIDEIRSNIDYLL